MSSAGAFTEQLFETQLVSLKDTQESISALSGWCLKHKEHHKKIVACWLYTLKRVKVDQRLTLFYLANDVIQYSKRKNLEFVDSWSTALQRATPLVRDDRVKDRILRIFDIWGKRQIYDESFVSDLKGLLTTTVRKKSSSAEPISEISDSNEFQPALLVKKIKELRALEANVASKLKRLKDCRIGLNDLEKIRSSVKVLDKKHGTLMIDDVEQSCKKVEAYVKALEQELAEREKLSELISQATLHYETERGEAKIIFNAYKSFGNRVKTLERKLEALIPTLPAESPLPSPDVNAPSPSPDSDWDMQTTQLNNSNNVQNDRITGNSNIGSNSANNIVLTEENNVNTSGGDLDLSFVNSSFIGNPQFIDNINNVFSNGPTEYRPEMSYSNPPPQPLYQQQPPPAHSSPPSAEPGGDKHNFAGSFNVAEFLKTLMTSSSSSANESIVQAQQPYSDQWQTPESPPQCNLSSTCVPPPIVYDDTQHHMPQIPDVDHRMLMTIPPPPVMEQQPLPDPTDVFFSQHDTDHRGLPPTFSVSDIALPPAPLKDIDHRNLINLTGSAAPPIDQTHVYNHGLEQRHDNVEHIDMDVSDNEEDTRRNHERGAGFRGFPGGRRGWGGAPQGGWAHGGGGWRGGRGVGFRGMPRGFHRGGFRSNRF